MTALKRPNWGIGCRGPAAPSATMQGIQHFYIIEVHWSDAQPGTSGGTVPPSPLTLISSSTLSNIQGDVNAVRQYNSGRFVLSATTTNGSTTIGFSGTTITSADVGLWVVGNSVPPGTYLVSVNAGAHTAVISVAATATSSAGLNVAAYTYVLTDVGTTSGSTTISFSGTELTSQVAGTNPATGGTGQYIVCDNIPLGTYIVSVNAGAHTAVLSAAATATGSNVTATIGMPQGLRMRVECGQYMPTWARAGAAAVAMVDQSGSPIGAGVGPWWPSGSTTVDGVPNLGPQQAYFAHFMNGLSNLVLADGLTVDQTPEIREVTPGLTMCKTDEVFWRYAGYGSNNANLVAAGFTGALDHAAMKNQMAIMGAEFQNTLIHLDCNPYNAVNNDLGGAPGGGSFSSKQAWMNDIVDYALGVGVYSTAINPGLQLTNASLDPTSNAGLYAVMQNYGPLGTGDAARNGKCSISFQTYQEPNVTQANLATTLARAISFGATSVEIINPDSNDTVTQIYNACTSSNYDQQLMQNRTNAIVAADGQDWPWTSSPAPSGLPPPSQYSRRHWRAYTHN